MKQKLLAFGVLFTSLIVNAQTPRLSLYEEFTGETCPPCASANPALNALLAQPANAAKCIAIKWQVPIPSAPSKPWSLYQTNKTEIDWRYRSTASGGYGYGISSAPSGKMDGQNVTVFGAASNHPNSLNSNIITTAQSYTSAFSVTMTRAWDRTCSAVNLTVNIQATAPFTAVGNLVFRTVMVERLIQFSVQPGTNGEKDFEDVGIKSYPTLQSGISMASTWTVGQTQTFTLSCPIPAHVRKKSEIAMVGFIQDDGDLKVAQAVRADRMALPTDELSLINAKVDVTCSNSINPVVSVQNDNASAVTNLTIVPYVDGVQKSDITWTGNLAANSSTDIALGSIVTVTNPGVHTFSFVAYTQSNPCNVKVVSNKAMYVVIGSYQGTPVVEGFVLGAFPPAKWSAFNNDNGTSWSRVTTAGAYQQTPMQSMKYDFYSNTKIGDVDEMLLPPVDLSGGASPELTFDRSYAQRNSSSDDKLEVFVSDNCGQTWQNVYTLSGVGLATATELTTSFIPNDPSQWVTDPAIVLTGYNKPNVLVKFVVTNDNGNNLYLDNINLSQSNPVGIAKVESSSQVSFKLYPNPTSGLTTIGVNAAQSGSAKIAVTNAIGQLVFEKNTNLSVGGNTIDVDLSSLPSGVYSISVDTNKNSSVKKLVVTH